MDSPTIVMEGLYTHTKRHIWKIYHSSVLDKRSLAEKTFSRTIVVKAKKMK